MKTTIFQFYSRSLCKALVFAVLTGMVSVQNLMAMPFISAHDPLYASATEVAPPDELRALSYTLPNSLLMVVHLENPAQEQVSILILNSRKKVVYRKQLGKPESFIGKYNLQNLPNDNYTLVVQSRSYTYSRLFSLQTFTERVMKVHEDSTNKISQEAI